MNHPSDRVHSEGNSIAMFARPDKLWQRASFRNGLHPGVTAWARDRWDLRRIGQRQYSDPSYYRVKNPDFLKRWLP